MTKLCAKQLENTHRDLASEFQRLCPELGNISTERVFAGLASREHFLGSNERVKGQQGWEGQGEWHEVSCPTLKCTQPFWCQLCVEATALTLLSVEATVLTSRDGNKAFIQMTMI